jgi:hypothetical protein
MILKLVSNFCDTEAYLEKKALNKALYGNDCVPTELWHLKTGGN